VRYASFLTLLVVWPWAQGGAAAGLTVDPDDVVITIDGVCGLPQSGSCKTVITRAQFEKLTEALQPGMSPALRLKVAQSYARVMRMAAAAEQRGLDRAPAFAEEMRYARMQLLAQDLTRTLQDEANNVSAADVDNYYRLNADSLETATLVRIFIPQVGREGHGNVAEMARLAANLRERAVAGEDPDTLQLEADKAAGVSLAAVPHTVMGNVRRVSLPPSHEIVMDMRVGEVSEVLSDPGGGHFIYKVLQKSTPALAEVEADIRARIAQQRARESLRPFEGGIELSDAYFAPDGASASVKRSHRDRTR
jgi:hypothetical protein